MAIDRPVNVSSRIWGSFELPEIRGGKENSVCVPNHTMTKVYSDGWATEDGPITRSLSLFMIQIPLVIIVSKSVHTLLRPLRQPRIVCDIISGIVVGNPGLGSIKGYREMFYPTKYRIMIRTISRTGLIFYIFLMGVKMDPAMVVQMGRKAVLIGFCSLILPFLVINTLVYYLKAYIPLPIVHGSFWPFLGALISTTSFPVVGDILTEFHLLNTELGRLGMSSAAVSDIFGWLAMCAFTFINQNQNGHAVHAMLAMVGMVVVVVFVFGTAVRRLARTIPRGSRVESRHLVTIMLCVLGVAFVSDAIGAAFVLGPMLMGLVVPDGPPLGSTLVEMLDLLPTEVFMPLFFFGTGITMEIPGLEELLKSSGVMIFILLVGYGTKMLGTILAARYFKIPLRKSTILGLIMNFRGVVEAISLAYLRSGKLLDPPSSTSLLFTIMASTAIAAPLVSIFYDPLSSNAVDRRTIQYLPETEETVILACVHNDNPVPDMINLLKASSPINEATMCVYALHLVQLVGCASSALLAHKNGKGHINPSHMDRLMNAFINFEQEKMGLVSIQPFTAVAPYKTMHNDVFALAVEKKVDIILLPYPRKGEVEGATVADHAVRAIIREILDMAPCSVGILVHHALPSPAISVSSFHYKVAVLFWGGPHDREALAYASRLARQSGVSVRVTRIVPMEDLREKTESRLDDQMVEDFKIQHGRNKQVVFEDKVAKDLEETIKTIKSVSKDLDLLMVGWTQGPNCYLHEGLAEWSDCPELGVLGDLLASSDFDCSSLILIVQQPEQHPRHHQQK